MQVNFCHCSDLLLKPIVTELKMTTQILSNAKYNYRTEPLFKKLNILPCSALLVF